MRTFAVLSLFAASAAQLDGPTVTLPGGGVLVGKQLASSSQFLGIRYAAAPTGDLRFRQAQPPPRLDAHSPPYDARSYGAPCIQTADPNTQPGPEAPPMDEDCLWLNVWRPISRVEAKPPGRGGGGGGGAPVLVWIHGGGFVLGAASLDTYNASTLAAAAAAATAATDDGDSAIIVSLNYRLGPLGFLPLTGLAGAPADAGTGGLNGVLDQIAALRWVHDNIAAFGGDASRVTIFGESAGGVSVCLLAASPLAAGLLHRAVVQSGPCTVSGGDDGWGPASAASGQAQQATLLQELGATDIASLRRVPAALLVWDAAVCNDPSFSGTFLDGHVMPKPPAHYYSNAGELNAPGGIMLGATSKDGTAGFYGTAPLWNASGQEAYAAAMRGRWGAASYEAVMAQYPLTRFNGSVPSAFLQADGDHTVMCPTREIAKTLALSDGTVPAWHYSYAHWSENGCDVALFPRGLNVTRNTSDDHFYDRGGWASHGAEVASVFGTTRGADYWGNRTVCPFGAGGEAELSEAMMAYWLSFAGSSAAGAPPSSSAPQAAGFAHWTPFTPAQPSTLQLSVGAREGGGTRMERDYKQADCDFWRRRDASLVDVSASPWLAAAPPLPAGPPAGHDAPAMVQWGAELFTHGQVSAAVEAFGVAMSWDGSVNGTLWQRGCALYYVEQWEEGAAQFALDVAGNPNDTEESVWRWLCQARSRGVAYARAHLLNTTGEARPYMVAVYEMFRSGAPAAEQAVLALCSGAGAAGSQACFYSDMYYGLYAEAHGNTTAACAHVRRAALSAYGPPSDDYMWWLTRVHSAVRGWQMPPAQTPTATTLATTTAAPTTTTPTFTQTVYDIGTDTCDKTAHKTVTKIALSTSTAQHCVEVYNWGKVIATCKSGTLTYTLFDNDNCTGHSAAGTRSWALGECVQGYGVSWMYTDCQETAGLLSVPTLHQVRPH